MMPIGAVEGMGVVCNKRGSGMGRAIWKVPESHISPHIEGAEGNKDDSMPEPLLY